MKYVYFLIIFIIGFAMGRLTIPRTLIKPTTTSQVQPTKIETDEPVISKQFENEKPPVKDEKVHQYVRSHTKPKDKLITKLFSQLMEADKKSDIEEQNRILAEMERLDSKNEKVFEAKVRFLQDDEDWDGAHKVLEECVSAIPESKYCLKRLANIRSSTLDEIVRYGTKCLEVSKNDPFCLVDLAIALRTKGDYEKSKTYLEQALNNPRMEGYNREYILYHYGMTLEKLDLYQKANDAFSESCKLNMKPACEKTGA